MPLAQIEKARVMGAFLLSGLLTAFPAFSACSLLSPQQTVHVRTVFDGDTVLLKDGRRVRLLGINTPEMGRDGRPDQPFAQAAKSTLKQLVTDQPLALVVGRQQKDRYGRILGHLYRPDGQHLAEALLQQGLGYRVSVNPNTRLVDCLATAERRAEQKAVGLWAGPVWQEAAALKGGMQGFMLLQGRVTHIQKTQRATWLELDDRLAVKIPTTLRKQLGNRRINALKGSRIAVRGWVVDRLTRSPRLKKGYKRWMLRLGAPSMLQMLTER